MKKINYFLESAFLMLTLIVSAFADGETGIGNNKDGDTGIGNCTNGDTGIGSYSSQTASTNPVQSLITTT